MTFGSDAVGFLELGSDGSIIDVPEFLKDALQLRTRGIESVWGFFDTESIPHLTVTRVIGGRGKREYHLAVVTETNTWAGFRFWDCSNEDQIRFLFVDDRRVHEAHEWELLKLRRYILHDVQNFVLTQFKNRLSTLHALTEVLRDNPDAARGSAQRILSVFGEFETVVDQLSVELDEEEYAALGVLVLALDTPKIVSTWSEDGIHVECLVADDVEEHFWIDSALLEMVLHPIVMNAIESRPESRTVHLHVECLKRAPMLAFEIVDGGAGMTAHELERAEDPFFTTKKGHAGLGLPRAKQVLEQIGGYWNIKSSRKSGTTVRVVVPIRHG